MADVVPIDPDIQILVEPHLRERLSEEWQERMDEMFAEVVYTHPGVTYFVTLNPLGDFPAFQFSCETGEFVGLTNWEYIQTVDVDAQLDSFEEENYWELVASVLEYYHNIEYRTTADYMKSAKNRTENEEASTEYGKIIYEYNCPAQTIYLTEEHYPVTWGEQRVDDTLEWYMYNFSEYESASDLVTSDDDSDRFSYKIPYEWKREEVSDE